jgi:endoglucanase
MKPYVYVRIGDLNNDGKVNMVDIALVASAFGSTPDGPRWNFDADINEDGIINLRDIAIVARNFLMPL